MRIASRLSALLLSIVLISCGDLVLGPDPENTPENNFDALWNEFDRYYALFEVKGVDWDSLYRVYRPRVTASTTERELFDVMAAMLSHLEDGHVTLTAPFASFGADTTRDDTSAIYSASVVLHQYLGGEFDTTAGSHILYGRIGDVGYIRIPSFVGKIDVAPGVSRWALEIDDVLASLRDARGIILDIRDNDGGNTFNAALIASRFTDQARLYQTFQSRKGPARNDFTDPFEKRIEPDGPFQFTGPVALITNGRSVSSAEWFTMAMSQLPHVRIIGDTTAGNLSGRMERELINGWTYSISVQKVLSPEGISYEGRGIPPDIVVMTTGADLNRLEDPILDRALQEL